MSVEIMRSPGTLTIHGRNLPEVWERSIEECVVWGDFFETEYDKANDVKSADCFTTLIIDDPMAEPRIHRGFPGGLEDLEIYTQEMVYGVHDNWTKENGGGWSYTYHDRLRNYLIDSMLPPVDQIENVIKTLAETPHSRRAQAVTWRCWEDQTDEEPPCLQRFHFRILEDELRMNTHIRSNDAFKAAFMNMYAFTAFQDMVAKEISKRVGKTIKTGRYVHVADSYHLYGSYMEEIEGFLRFIKKSPWENRVYHTPDVQYFLDSGKIILINSSQCSIATLDKDRLRLYNELSVERQKEVIL